jgi:hypothetical protein
MQALGLCEVAHLGGENGLVVNNGCRQRVVRTKTALPARERLIVKRSSAGVIAIVCEEIGEVVEAG